MQPNIPSVSVIIPFYNQIKWVTEAVDSVLTQTFKDFEVILVDDGSSESIKDSKIDFSNERIKYIRKENSGPGASRNVGIDAARGKFIAFLDADDLFEKTKLEKQIIYMEDKNIDFCHTCYITFDGFGNERVMNTSWFKGNVFESSFVSLPIATPTIMVKRTALENPKKRFAEYINFGEDGYLWIQLSKDYDLYCLPEALSRVRIRGENTATKAKKQLQAKSQLYDILSDTYILKDMNISVEVIFLYKLCKIAYLFTEKITNTLKLNSQVAEVISKIIYFPLWLGFKLLKNLHKKN